MSKPTLTAQVNFPRTPRLEDHVLRQYKPAIYLRLNDATGLVAIDRYGGNHGAYTNSPTLGRPSPLPGDALLGGAVEFDGSNDYVTVSDAASLDWGDTFYVSACIYRDATGTKHYVAQKGTGAWGIYVGTDDKLTLEKVGTADIVKSTVTIPATTWTRIQVSKSGSTVFLRINGIDRTGTATNQTCASTASALELGRSAAAANQFDGRMSDFVGMGSVPTVQNQSIEAAAFLFGQLEHPTYCAIASRVHGFWTNAGANAARTGDRVGDAQLTLKNTDNFFSAERNLAPNPSAELGLHDFETAITSFVTAGATIAWVADPATDAGSYAAQYTSPASADRGGGQLLEGLFYDDEPVTARIYIRALSGTPTVQIGLGSTGTPADVNTANCVLSTAYGFFDVTLTPTADREDLAVFWRDHAGAGVSWVVDRIQVNRGSTPNTWIEAPTWPMLQPGALALLSTTHVGTTTDQFSGTVDVLDAKFGSFRAEMRLTDAFGDLAVPIDLVAEDSVHYVYRQAVLDRAIAKQSGAYRNMCIYGSFENGLVGGSPLSWGWALTNASVVSTWADTGTYSCKVQGDGNATYSPSGVIPIERYYANRLYRVTWKMKLVGSADEVALTWGVGDNMVQITTGGVLPSPSSTPQEYTLIWLNDIDRVSTGFPSFIVDPTSGNSARGVYIDSVMITEGPELHDYVEFDEPFGRQENLAAALYQAAEVASPWTNGWHNHIGNPEALVDVSGWSASTDGFITSSGGSVSRITGSWGLFGTAIRISGSQNRGARYRLTGTFYLGVTYQLRYYLANVVTAASSVTARVGLGDQANPSDSASNLHGGGETGWRTLLWAPSANRTSVDVYGKYEDPSGVMTLDITGITVTEIAVAAYAREGVQSPSPLISASSIATVAAAGISRGKATRITTRAVAGSGAALVTTGYRVALRRNGAAIKVKLVSGGTTIAIGVAHAYGLASADLTTKTYTLQTGVWLTLPINHLATQTVWNADPADSDQPLFIYLMTTSATAVTVDVAEEQLYRGAAIPPFLPYEASAIDTTDDDALPDRSLAGGDAVNELKQASGITGTRHAVRYLPDAPWWQYWTESRESTSAKAIAATYDDDAKDVVGFAFRRDDVYTIVTVRYAGVEVLSATASQKRRDRIAKVRELAIDATDWLVSAQDAQDVADWLLRRFGVARERITLRREGKDSATLASLLEEVVGDRVKVNSDRALLQGQSVIVLTRRLEATLGDAEVWAATSETEDWVPVG